MFGLWRCQHRSMQRPQSKLSPAPSTGFRSTCPRWLRKLLDRWLATRRSSRFPANSKALNERLAEEKNALAVCQVKVRSGCLAGRRSNSIFPRSIITVQTKSQSSRIHRVARRASRRCWRSCLSRPVRTRARCMMRRAARLEGGREDSLLPVPFSIMFFDILHLGGSNWKLEIRNAKGETGNSKLQIRSSNF